MVWDCRIGMYVPDVDEALGIEVQLTRVVQVSASLGLPFHAHLDVVLCSGSGVPLGA